MFAIVVWSLSVRAQPPFAGLIVYALDSDTSFLLLVNRADTGNTWTTFAANAGWTSVEDARASAIRRAVGNSRCYFSISGLERIVELSYFRQPWESPAYLVYFARVPKIQRSVLEDDNRDCPEAGRAPKEPGGFAWVPWKALRADIAATSDAREAFPVRLISSAQYLPERTGEATLLPGFAAALRGMIAESERKDSTVEFTLPW